MVFHFGKNSLTLSLDLDPDSELDSDPHLPKRLDPDPHIMHVDPKHGRTHLSKIHVVPVVKKISLFEQIPVSLILFCLPTIKCCRAAQKFNAAPAPTTT
jgi:hypothetical protein